MPPERTDTTPGPEPGPRLTAYVLDPDAAMPLVPAAPDRDWMRAVPGRAAFRCLPLTMANQAGWFLLSAHTVRAVWDGGASPESLTVAVLSGPDSCPALSHFGSGVLSWVPPYLFRTPPDWNLLVRGPANAVKDGIAPLEGLVETDWTPATFTVNWKLTRPGFAVTFAEGEPVAMLVPQRRGELESFRPVTRPVGDDSELARAVEAWADARTRFVIEAQMPDTDAFRAGWQGDYFRGETPGGARAAQHQTRLRLRPFGPAE